MRPYALAVQRYEALKHTRTYEVVPGQVTDVDGWTSSFVVNFIPQLHGEDGVALELTLDETADGKITRDDEAGRFIVDVEQPALETLGSMHSQYLWVWTITPDEAGANPILLGWGTLEIGP